jgi:hypothetical protein
MASVKWLVRLEAATQPFHGFFQYDRYILPPLEGEPEPRPLRNTLVRSVILAPATSSTILAGPCRIRGLAWSGVAPVTKIECSTNGGQSWHAATWTSREEPYAWRGWEYHWQAEPGEHTVCARAEDAAGNVQPTEAEWNLLGYANNALHTVPVSVIADGR